MMWRYRSLKATLKPSSAEVSPCPQVVDLPHPVAVYPCAAAAPITPPPPLPIVLPSPMHLMPMAPNPFMLPLPFYHIFSQLAQLQH
ncbi:unnamed protein product [Heligmosomoides polygyrus]|uniref:RNA-binding protein 12-like n=1 Tax=Heligmosomoides polygyrus TaxID=6339 RepID=A0A183GHT4_HELPZ|nr:unnamed protein product [Heligmosomoides polygyrus]